MSSPRLPRALPAAGLALLALLLLAFLPAATKKSFRADFERYYHAGKNALAGRDPYAVRDDRQFKYFPVFAQCMMPVAWFGGFCSVERAAVPPARDLDEELRFGAALWHLILSACWLGAIALAVSLARRSGDPREALFLGAVAVAFTCRFALDNLKLGQINLPVVFLAVAGVWCVARGREVAGGALTALAAAIKFMPALLLLWFLLRRRWRAAGAFALALPFLVLVAPAGTWGAKGAADLLSRYAEARHRMVTDLPKEQASGQSLPSLVNRLVRPVNAAPLRDGRPLYIHRVEWSPEAARRLAGGLVALAVFLAVLLLHRTRGAGAPALEAGLIFLLMLMISPEARKAQYIALLLPAAALAAELWATRSRRLAAVLAAAFGALALTSEGVLEAIARAVNLLLKGTGERADAAEAVRLLNAWGVLLFGALLLAAATASCLMRRNAGPSGSSAAEVR